MSSAPDTAVIVETAMCTIAGGVADDVRGDYLACYERDRFAEFLDERLPSSRVRLTDAGHFVWAEEPVEYASIILTSITGSSS